MTGIFDVDWAEVFAFSVSPLEMIVRGTAMYWFLFVIFRFVVRRDVGSVGVADILILVIVADAAQNGMSGEYTSVADGMILVGTLIFWNALLDRLSFHFPVFARFTKAPSLLLVRNGRMLHHNMRREYITEDELWTQLREQGVDDLSQVRKAYLEPDGEFSVVRKDE
jgi:uncharacterized membrane protein YcaP (DUF421 family)